MARNKYFDLEKRVIVPDQAFASVEKCREYDLNLRSSLRLPMARVASLLSQFCKKGSQVLEVGSATGLLSLILGGQHPEVDIYGIEENTNLLQVAEENETLAALVNSPARAEFKYGDLSNFPVEDKSVDIVYSYTVLHRFRDPLQTIKECHRVCKPGGLVMIYDLARDADEGMLFFILQYVSDEQDRFMNALRSSFSKEEMVLMLKEAGLTDWHVVHDEVNLCISSKELIIPKSKTVKT